MTALLLASVLIAPTADPRGPVFQSAGTPLVGYESVQARAANPSHPPTPAQPGTANWIWVDAAKSPDAARFIKTIDLNGNPRTVRAWISADVRYRLWINGRLAARGPADPGRDYDSAPPGPWFADIRDLTPLFHSGRNGIAVEIFSKPLVQSESTTTTPGVQLNLAITDARGILRTLGTDSTWLASPAPDLDQTGTHGFQIDLRKEPTGWQMADGTHAAWTNAVVRTDRITPTIPSELPAPMEAIVNPVAVLRASEGVHPTLATGGALMERDGSYTLKLPHLISGYVSLKVRAHAGARLHISPTELDSPGESRGAELLLRDGEQEVELPFLDSFSVVRITGAGIARPIDIQEVRCVISSYPVRYTGSFVCSKPEWNTLWNTCRWVTQICMQTHYLDSPNHQEPVSDAGDYLIESLNAAYAFGDGALARQDLKKISRTLRQRDEQSFHTSYSLLWLRMLLQHYRLTGDLDTVKQLAGEAFRLLDRFSTYIGPNGLVSEAPNYMFMDWVDVAGYNLHHPPAVLGQGYMSALYVQALDDGATVADLTGRTNLSATFRQRRDTLAQAMDRELFVPDLGLYRDGRPFQTSVKPNQWLPADRQMETWTTQCNALAVACGVATGPRARQVMQNLLDRPDLHCEPYFMHFVFQALQSAGLTGQTLPRLLERWKIVPETGTYREMWDVGDLSHGWEASPLYELSAHVLGVVPTAPGFARFRIAPTPCGLSWARGSVPTPHGPIRAQWTLQANHIDLRFTVPRGAEAEVGTARYAPGAHRVSLPNLSYDPLLNTGGPVRLQTHL